MSAGSSLPLVSVVIPVYNGAAFLGEAITSVLAQTYSRIEVVVVDDGSTDDTPKVIRSFGESVRAIRQENSGVGPARNRGIAEARGRYVAFLDADDLWLPGKIERQVDLAEANPEAGLVYCGYAIVDEHLAVRSLVPAWRPIRRLRRTYTLDSWGVGLPFTGLVRADVIAEVGGFRADLSTSADLEFSMRVAEGRSVAAVPGAQALYRAHGAQMHLDRARFMDDMSRFYEIWFSSAEVRSRMRRRARANLAVRAAADALLRGDRSAFWRASTAVLRSAPSRLLLAPLGGFARRLVYRAMGTAVRLMPSVSAVTAGAAAVPGHPPSSGRDSTG